MPSIASPTWLTAGRPPLAKSKFGCVLPTHDKPLVEKPDSPSSGGSSYGCTGALPSSTTYAPTSGTVSCVPPLSTVIVMSVCGSESNVVDRSGPSTICVSGRPNGPMRSITRRRRPGPAGMNEVIAPSDGGNVSSRNVPSDASASARVGNGVMRPLPFATQNALVRTSADVVSSPKSKWPSMRTVSPGRAAGRSTTRPCACTNGLLDGAATVIVVVPLRTTFRPASCSARTITCAGNVAG